jgi:hypothetical protein
MKRMIVTCFFYAIAVIGTSATAAPATSAGDDSGYFLSWKQKGQLIGLGRMQDSTGMWYDVWICPGYVAPSRNAWNSLQSSRSAFGEYFEKEKYHNLAETSGDAYEWAFKDCLKDFTIEGVPEAWKDHFSAARDRTRKRVFGWWFAYPWAFMTSTADNVVRIPLGLAGTALGFSWGTAVVPAYYMVNSSVKGTWDLAAGAVTVPAAGYAWNTMVSPPLALVGQKPAPSRVDGFWVRTATREQIEQAARAERPLTRKDLEHLAEWGQILLAESQSFSDRLEDVNREEREAIHKIQKDATEKRSEVQNAQSRHFEELLRDPTRATLRQSLEAAFLDKTRIARLREQSVAYLKAQKGLSNQDAYRTLQLLQQYPPVGTARPDLEKTDVLKANVQESREVLDDL